MMVNGEFTNPILQIIVFNFYLMCVYLMELCKHLSDNAHCKELCVDLYGIIKSNMQTCKCLQLFQHFLPIQKPRKPMFPIIYVETNIFY